MKLSFNKYGAPCADGASLNISTLATILDCLDIAHTLTEAPAEMRADNFKLASDYEAAANKKELFKIMLNQKAALDPIVVTIESQIAQSGTVYEVVTNWGI
jgi:hypothetical protein